MSEQHLGREQRMVFGEEAELYDTARAGYPEALVDDVVAHLQTTTRRALEVGAGTGKATLAFARRDLDIVALEPDAAMAAVATRNCASHPKVSIQTTTLEDWPLEEKAFGLVFSAQAWHWVDPEVRYVKAAQALLPGGTLALFWHRTDWAGESLRDELDDLYGRLAPDLRAQNPAFPGLEPQRFDQQIDAEVEGSGRFGDIERFLYRWPASLTADSLTALLLTQSNHRLYPDERRRPLLDGVRQLIADRGGSVTIPNATLLLLARARAGAG